MKLSNLILKLQDIQLDFTSKTYEPEIYLMVDGAIQDNPQIFIDPKNNLKIYIGD